MKAVDASIPVGGPATAQLAWIPEFLEFCSSSGAPVDFVSSHLYPTDPYVSRSLMGIEMSCREFVPHLQIGQDRNGFVEAVAAAAGLTYFV